ncbi:DUF47 domain-containing protein [Desulfospira joergensenii]|uniref:DUF47 domain-containing protein n=1 Tax=Desulfospira joergensenii TaxID=53329 RepID=UPI0003B6C4F7|nr:DUF47 family protein [Desulfospira joergensenii]
MFNFFFKKENQVNELIYSYLDNFQLIYENFRKAVFSCIREPSCEEFSFLQEQTHKYESKADDIKNEINNLMYGKVLIPDSREDIMGLILAVDKIPGNLEIVLSMIKYQKLSIPEPFAADFSELITASLEACTILPRQVIRLIQKKTGIRDLMNQVDERESYCDHIETKLIQNVFNSEIDPFIKLQLKELILKVGDISDQADKVSKLINILSLKRRV